MKPHPASTASSNTACSPWPHRWAWLLGCATLPLIWWGGFVTTTDAGMAFRDWITSDGHFMLTYPWLESTGDKFIEHGHRLLGVLVGLLTILMVVVTFRCDSRRYAKWLSLALLAGVLLQGALGALRVVLDQRTLALVHGCTGPLFFALCAAMIVITSRWWHTHTNDTLGAEAPRVSAGLRNAAILTCVLAYIQLIVGAFVRHTPYLTNPQTASLFQAAVYFHVVLAVLILVQVLLLAFRSSRQTGLRGYSALLSLLVGCQIVLGVATWLSKYGVPAWASRYVGEANYVIVDSSTLQAAIITTHVAVGSLIIAAAVAIAMRASRLTNTTLPTWPMAGANSTPSTTAAGNSMGASS